MKKPTSDDYPKLFELLKRAFAPSMYESDLARDLKDKGKISFDFIIEEGGQVLAYICYSTAYGTGRTRIGYHLAPVAVLPERQREGLGAGSL